MSSFQGIIASLVADPDATFRQKVEFDHNRILKLSTQAGDFFRRSYANLLSVFELEGPNGLFSTLQTYGSRKGVIPEINKALEAGDESAFINAAVKNLAVALVDLYERGALRRIQIVDELPALAAQDLANLQAIVRPPAPAAAAVASVSETDTEIQLCAREYRELSTDDFRRRWVNSSKRHIFEAADARGLIGFGSSTSPDRSQGAAARKSR